MQTEKPACEKCDDTGLVDEDVAASLSGEHNTQQVPCSCPMGQCVEEDAPDADDDQDDDEIGDGPDA